MKRQFRSSTLERDFHTLFDESARWKWPFCGGGIIGTIINLGITTFLASVFIGVFFHFELHRNEFAGLAGVIFVWETVRLNWRCIAESRRRLRLRRKYQRVVEHTEAYELLEEALASRRKGVVNGLGTKEETEASLMRLWKAAFAEADCLASRSGVAAIIGDPVDAQPVGEHIHRYFEERAASYQEIGR
ncbi:MAG: hypothetical protein P4L46_00775 [Fimbriimonas sp.]|nr:hypothetical protein [Fimbriimonas sp.]